MAVRRGKFRAFMKSPSSLKYEEHSFTSSVRDGEISVEVSVGPRGKLSERVCQ